MGYLAQVALEFQWENQWAVEQIVELDLMVDTEAVHKASIGSFGGIPN